MNFNKFRRAYQNSAESRQNGLTRRRNLVLVLFGSMFLTEIYIFNGRSQFAEQDMYQKRRVAAVSDIPLPKEVVLLIILCDGNGRDVAARSLNRQMKHTETLLKSAIELTATKLRVIIVSESEDLFNRLVNVIDKWPEDYREAITLQYLAQEYPADRQNMKYMFRPCATQRLFIPPMLPDEDAIIYIDTDFLFMTPPEELWDKFNKFDSKQFAAMSPCLTRYGKSSSKTVPYFGESGLNAGLMLMNLTRIRSFPQGWVTEVMHGYDKHKDNVTQADQDILNIFFNKYPDLMYELGCEWNYRMYLCIHHNKCPITSREGASLLHGNALAFASRKESRMKTVYDCWSEHRLGTPMEQLYSTMMDRLQEVSVMALPVKCYIEDIDTVLIQKLGSHVNKLKQR